MARREHRHMSSEQQRAAGRAARSRGELGNAEPNRQVSYPVANYPDQGYGSQDYGSQEGRYPAPNARHPQGGADGYGQGDRQARRTVSEGEVYDASRYRRMRQQREEATPLGRVRKAAQDRERAQAYSEDSPERRHGLDGHRALKYAKRTLIGVLVALLAFSVLITVRLGSGISLETRGALTPALPGTPFYMLLVGTDKSADRVENNSTDGVYRTDSIILARVDPIAAKLTLVSIQRDTAVDLGGDYGTQKINAAYTYGGAPLLIKTVSQLAGVPIAHYAEIDLDQFISVVDTIGGVEVNVPVDVYDPEYTGADIKAGVQTLNGDQALKLCRARHAYDKYGAGDYYRTANQRMVLGAILKKALSGNPFTLLATLNTASNSVSTDITGIELMLLGARFVGFNMSTNLYSALEPTTSSYEDGIWYERVDEAKWQTMMSRVGQGLPPYEDSSEDPTAGVAANAN